MRFFFGRDMHFFHSNQNRPHFSFDSGTVRAFCAAARRVKSQPPLFFLAGAFLFRIIIAIKAGRDVDDAGRIVASRHFGGGSIARRKNYVDDEGHANSREIAPRKRRRKVIERLGTGEHEREFRCRGYFREQLYHFRAGSETRVLLRAVFYPRLNLNVQGGKSSTDSNVDAVVELGIKDQDQWVQAISKAIKSRKEKENEESVPVVDVNAFVESVPVVSDALKSIRENLKRLLENTNGEEDSFVTTNVYAPIESAYLNSSRTTTRGSSTQSSLTTKNKHFTLKKLEKPRRKSYLETSAKRVNRFGDVISNVDSSTAGATTIGATGIVSKSLESSFQQQQQQPKPKSSFLLDTKKRTISSHGYQISGTKRTFESRDGSAKDKEKEKEIRLQRLKLMKEREAERKRLAEEEMKKRRENYKASVEAKKRALDIQEKSKTTTISTPSPSDRT